MKSQQWLRLRLGALRHQTLTWATVDPAKCRHVASWLMRCHCNAISFVQLLPVAHTKNNFSLTFRQCPTHISTDTRPENRIGFSSARCFHHDYIIDDLSTYCSVIFFISQGIHIFHFTGLIHPRKHHLAQCDWCPTTDDTRDSHSK